MVGLYEIFLQEGDHLSLRREIYAVWAAVGGLLIGLGVFKGDIALYFLLVIITSLRILSLIFKWRLPFRKIVKDE